MKAKVWKDNGNRWCFVVPMPDGAIALHGAGWSHAHAMELVHGIIKAKWSVKT